MIFPPIRSILLKRVSKTQAGNTSARMTLPSSASRKAAGVRWARCSRPVSNRLHFTLTLDLKPTAARQTAISKLILMANERLWLGHFDYWIEDQVVLFRHTLPMLDRVEPDPGEIRAVLAAATDAVNMFVPAFNFVIWAGKSPEEAIDAALFETDGEA